MKFSSARLLTAVYLPCILTLLALIPLSGAARVSYANFLRDPLAIYGGMAYLGCVSNFGVLFWALGAAASLVAWRLLAVQPPAERAWARFFMLSFAVLGYLLLDDLFMLHEQVWPWIFSARGWKFSALDACVILLYLVSQRSYLLQGEKTLLVSGLGCLAASIVVDEISERLAGVPRGLKLSEDIFKFLGVVAWGVFQTRLALAQIRLRCLKSA